MVAQGISQLWSDIMELFYPRVCSGCSKPLVHGEEIICIECLYQLPRTHFHQKRDNPVEQIFWGRIPIKYATAFCFYRKESTLQKLILQLKYHGEKEIGEVLGHELGYELKYSVFEEIDVVIPIPLHPKRLKKRGYNQAECIAKALSEVLQKPLDTTSVRRKTATETQTKKTRYERWLNVENIFEIVSPESIEGKHILIVDDIVTTGSTIESLVQELLTLPNVTCSLAAIGVADNR
ncbi:MAG TPA: ComF family protein [Salinivirgaceae bacterium]|nr:ComF family protein [Salinivirgaceae bacterium]